MSRRSSPYTYSYWLPWDWLSFCKFSYTWPQNIIHHKSSSHFNFNNQYTSQCVGKRVLSLGTCCMRTKGWIGLPCLGMLGSLPGSHKSSLETHPSLNPRLLYKILVSKNMSDISLHTSTKHSNSLICLVKKSYLLS